MSETEEKPSSPDNRELLIRLDERLRNAMSLMEQREIFHKADMERQATLIATTIRTFTSTLTGMTNQYASKGELETVKSMLRGDIGRVERIVYGACGLILIAVVGALLSGIMPPTHH